ncbi:MAG: acyloxyacyl hydrolase [Geobacteraceae bacterium]|nr:acyloxyacyl hydrolase [Geobacteraceae bacterium]
MVRIALILMMLIALLSATKPAEAGPAEEGWHEAGIRAGFQEGTRDDYFHHYELFGVYGLPYDWRASSGWGVGTYVETSAGVLYGSNEAGFIGTVGPGLTINKSGSNLALDIGINVNVMDRRRFGKQNFGSMLLFGAYLGASYRIVKNIKVEYRILHMSNGHILYPNGTPNPGLDSHVVGVSWTF